MGRGGVYLICISERAENGLEQVMVDFSAKDQIDS